MDGTCNYKYYLLDFNTLSKSGFVTSSSTDAIEIQVLRTIFSENNVNELIFKTI